MICHHHGCHHHRHHRHHHHHRHCLVPGAQAEVTLLLGERRVVVQRLINDAPDPITFTPTISSVVDVTNEQVLSSSPVTLATPVPITLAPGQGLDASYHVDATGLSVRHVYRVEVSFEGTFIPRLVLAVFVERTAPIVARHDASRLRAWLRGHCFEREPQRWRSLGSLAVPEHVCCRHER